MAAAPVTRGQSSSAVRPFPELQDVPGAGVSQTFITNQLHQLAADHRLYKRSVIYAAAAPSTVVCADFQHDPTKHVHANGGRCYTGIFNIYDIKSGEHHPSFGPRGYGMWFYSFGWVVALNKCVVPHTAAR